MIMPSGSIHHKATQSMKGEFAAGDCGVGLNLWCVVPANAGTHNHQVFGYRWPYQIALLRRMGPRFRGDDSNKLSKSKHKLRYLITVNSRLQRIDNGQLQMCQAGSPPRIERNTICALPMMFSSGT